MRKKTKYKKHPVKPDEKYNSPVVGKLINKVMSNGERRIARRIVYQTAEVVEKWYQEQQKKASQKQKEESKVSPVAEEKKGEEQVPKEEKEITGTTNPPFLTVLEKAIEKVSPDFEVRRRKVGSGVHRIPVKIEKERGLKISLRWMVISAREKTTHNPMSERLAEEIINAYQGTGSAFKRKEDIRKEIENR